MSRRYAFGELEDRRAVDAIEIGSRDGVHARVLTYGANLAGLWVPTSDRARNVVLGHYEIGPYLRSVRRMARLLEGMPIVSPVAAFGSMDAW